MHTSKLSSKSQVTLPKEIRDALGARPGDTIVYSEISRIEFTLPYSTEIVYDR